MAQRHRRQAGEASGRKRLLRSLREQRLESRTAGGQSRAWSRQGWSSTDRAGSLQASPRSEEARGAGTRKGKADRLGQIVQSLVCRALEPKHDLQTTGTRGRTLKGGQTHACVLEQTLQQLFGERTGKRKRKQETSKGYSNCPRKGGRGWPKRQR